MVAGIAGKVPACSDQCAMGAFAGEAETRF